MSATNTAATMAFEVLAKKDNPTAALSVAERAARLYPEFRWPVSGGGTGPTFAMVAAGLRNKLGTVEAPALVPESAPKKTAPPARKASRAKKTVTTPPVVAEPVKPTVEVTTLRVVHDGVLPTSIYGTTAGSPGQIAIGKAEKGGLGWKFTMRGEKCFYLPLTGGYAPNMTRINEAIDRLSAIEVDGVKLYKLDIDVRTVDADGTVLPGRMDVNAATLWQREYTSAKNSLWAELGLSMGVCAKCGVRGIDQRTGQIVKGTGNMPQQECVTCPEAAVDLGSLTLALPGPDQVEECPACRKGVAVVDGRLALHNDQSGSRACRGRRGVVVVDVEAEPATVPVKVSPVKRVAKSARPSVAELGIVITEATGLTVRFAVQSTLSGTACRNIATEVRQEISKRISYGRTFKGVKVEVRRDKVTRQLTLTVTEGGERYDAEALSAELVKVTKSVRGVTNQVHKTA